MRILVALFLLTMPLAGCLDDGGPDGPDAPDAPGSFLPTGVQVFGGDGSGPAGSIQGRAEYVLTGFQGAEPNIGATSDGSLFISAGSSVIRSQDQGATWQEVQRHEALNSDPMLWVDPWTDRVYNAPMFPILLCASIYWSDDFGDSWTDGPAPDCGRTVYDHQKLASGPPGPDAPAVAGLLYPTVLVMCYNGVATTNCASSFDGGQTWPHDEPVNANVVPATEGTPLTGCDSGQNGHPTFSNEGVIVFARALGCPVPYIVRSFDSGLTWELLEGPDDADPQSLDPEIAFGPDETMYLLYQGSDDRKYLARSHDYGDSWDGPWAASPPGVGSTSFDALAAGSDGRIAMAYLGASNYEGDPSDAPDEARYHLYLVTSDDALSDDPTFVSHQATPDTDPVQVGAVWQGGGGEPSRNLLDFIDGAIAPDGTFYVAYAEGCTGACADNPDATPSDSRDRATSVAMLRGWSLYADA